MAGRIGIALLVVLTFFGLPDAGEKKNSHPGDVVDAGTQTGIRADATAYGSDTKEGDDACPQYKDQLDVTHSAPGTGDFHFEIDSQRRSYLATYCQGGYVPRTVRENDNAKNDTRVQPDPIQLYPNLATLKARQMDRVDFADRVIGTLLDRAHEDLAYYTAADEAGFYGALDKGSARDREIVKYLLSRPPNASLRPRQHVK
jgi:hypothetical protein